MSERTVLSLFAGIGGFDLGLERAGFRCVGQVELEPFCQRVLAARWPGVERAADVRGYATRSSGASPEPSGLERLGEPVVDLLVGGFPCQDLSVAGKRAGLGGERSGLFWEIVRIAKIKRPTWGLFENVPGLVSSHRGSDMALVIAGLRECWPVVGWRILDSRYFGVAQRRRRVFFVCGPTEAGVAKVLALTEGGAGDPEAGGEAGAHVAHAISAGAGGSKFGSGRDGQDDFVIADPLTSSYAKHGGAAAGKDSTPRNIVTGQCHGGNVGPMGTLRKGNGDVTGGVPFVAASEPFTLASRGRGDTHQLEVRQDGLANAILTPNGGRGGIGVGAIAHALTGEGHDASEDGTGRGTPMVVAFHEDQRTGSIYENDHTHALAQPGGKPGQGYQAVREGSAVRRLTPLECERLQSFPDGWTCLCQPLEAYAADPDAAALACACPDSPRYRALGNAVTVNVISWLGQRLKEVMNEQVG